MCHQIRRGRRLYCNRRRDHHRYHCNHHTYNAVMILTTPFGMLKLISRVKIHQMFSSMNKIALKFYLNILMRFSFSNWKFRWNREVNVQRLRLADENRNNEKYIKNIQNKT